MVPNLNKIAWKGDQCPGRQAAHPEFMVRTASPSIPTGKSHAERIDKLRTEGR